MSKLLKLVQIGKRQLNMDDDIYRNILEELTYQRSARGLSDKQLNAVITRFKSLGFQPKTSPKTYQSREIQKIRAIWITMYQQGFIRDRQDSAIDAYVRRMTTQLNGIGIARLTWLKSTQASAVLDSLKAWHLREMTSDILKNGGRIPRNSACTGPAGYDRLAAYYVENYQRNDK